MGVMPDRVDLHQVQRVVLLDPVAFAIGAGDDVVALLTHASPTGPSGRGTGRQTRTDATHGQQAAVYAAVA